MMLNKYPDWILAIVSGITVGVAYLPFNTGFLIYIGFVPLFPIWLNKSIKTSAAMSYLAAITSHFIAYYWMGLNQGASPIVALLSLSAAVFYLGLFWVLAGISISYLQKRFKIGLIIFPFVWIAMEMLRSFGPLGFSWGDLVLTQVSILPMIQTADVAGTAGITLFICILNGLLYLALITDERKQFIFRAIGLWVLVFIFGSWRMNVVEKNSNKSDFSVAVIQPNVNPVQKWDRTFRAELISLMDSLTIQAMKLKPDFILWPESALPTYLRTSLIRTTIQSYVSENNIPLLAGTIDKAVDENGKHYYNGSILLNADGSYKMYHKVHLVPFAEYIPLSNTFPQLKDLNFGQGNFDHGEEFTIFNVHNKRFGNMICYESSFPRIAKEFVDSGAEFLTIQTNDAWSGDAPGAYQHFAVAQIRAVENRVPVVRSANTGISGIISPSGKVEQKLAFYDQGIIFGSLTFMADKKHYPGGDVFALLCIFFGLSMVVWEWTRKNS
jgi:apolipoprotein N-acyltransferase